MGMNETIISETMNLYMAYSENNLEDCGFKSWRIRSIRSIGKGDAKNRETWNILYNLWL